MSDPELAADDTAEPAAGSPERAARARKLAADLRGTRDDRPAPWRRGTPWPWSDDRDLTVSAVLDRAAAHFERGEHALGVNLAAAAQAALGNTSDRARGYAEAYEGTARREAGNPFGDLADGNAREARETAARLQWQADRARQLAARPGGGTAGTTDPRETAPGTGPLAGVAAAARQLAADVRRSPVRGTYFSDRYFPDLVPADTRLMASTELELAAARFDQGNESLGREHLANALRILNSRSARSRRGWWERLNDEHPRPEDFPYEAFNHANRAGMIEDALNAARPAPAGSAAHAGAARDPAATALSAGPDFMPPGTRVTPRAPGPRADRPGRHAASAPGRQPGRRSRPG
jgi:hypothetical protein